MQSKSQSNNNNDKINLIESPKKENNLFKSNSKENQKGLFGSAPSGELLGELSNSNRVLFGNIEKKNSEKKNTPVNSLFSNPNNNSFQNSLFSKSSLFNNPELFKGSTLFGNLNKPELNFSNKEKTMNSDNDEEDQEAEEFFKKDSEKIVGFKPDENSSQINSDFEKIFIKQVDQLFIFSKEYSKYVSKGKGFISLEKYKKNGSALVIFRNPMGVKLLEGVINVHSKEVEKSSKNYKNIASFSSLEIKDNKPLLKLCKIPVISDFLNILYLFISFPILTI